MGVYEPMSLLCNNQKIALVTENLRSKSNLLSIVLVISGFLARKCVKISERFAVQDADLTLR